MAMNVLQSSGLLPGMVLKVDAACFMADGCWYWQGGGGGIGGGGGGFVWQEILSGLCPQQIMPAYYSYLGCC